MMHSIQIISPIEDFDEKELEAWEKMMKLEGSVDDCSSEKNDQISIQEVLSSSTMKSIENSYCFSRTHLITAFILMSSMTVILSLVLYIICSYLSNRNLFNGEIQDKIAYSFT
ncbi:hypothetical protein SSS_05239 [Sarcoptes scabiei]|nr:hypothetical protein SSS_05239 [Sarcoptes scabiei]